MVVIKKKISTTFVAFMLSILGLYFMSSSLVFLNESTEFLQSYAVDDLSDVNIESITDTKLLIKLLEVEKGKTIVILKLSQTLNSEVTYLLTIGLVLFFFIIFYKPLFYNRIEKKN